MSGLLRICGSCIYWRPLQSYPTIGRCSRHNKMMPRDNGTGCRDYARKNLSWFEFMWCLTCGTLVYRDDYDLHIGHEMYPEPYIDEDIHEETYTAD